MRILNTKNPNDVVKIYPWFIPAEKLTRMDIAAQLYDRLETRPEDTLVLVAIERNITRSILVAHVSDKKKKRVWLWQANSEPGFKYSKLMFDALKSWMIGRGAKEIWTGTDRNARVLSRRWGFEPLRNGNLRLRVR